MGIEGRYHWLGKLRDWLLDNGDRVADTMQSETGKVRAEATTEAVYLTDLINFYGSQGRQVHRRRERAAPLAAARHRRS